jgi:hypothetical protein
MLTQVSNIYKDPRALGRTKGLGSWAVNREKTEPGSIQFLVFDGVKFADIVRSM